jgi:hypothetical protein
MGRASTATLPGGTVRLSYKRVVRVGIALTATWLGAGSAAAQETSPAGADPSGRSCQVVALDAAEGQAGQVFAGCRGLGLFLGQADVFEVHTYPALPATLVDVRRGGERRLLLISFPRDDAPLVEDLTGQIARLAGRSAMSAIDGVEVDLATFARDGVVEVRSGGARGGRISVSDQVGRESAKAARETSGN